MLFCDFQHLGFSKTLSWVLVSLEDFKYFRLFQISFQTFKVARTDLDCWFTRILSIRLWSIFIVCFRATSTGSDSRLFRRFSTLPFLKVFLNTNSTILTGCLDINICCSESLLKVWNLLQQLGLFSSIWCNFNWLRLFRF